MRSIRLKDVTKSRSEGLILNNVNLTIPSGEFFALLGPSGCGKTTLLRLIAGFEQLDGGAIYLGNNDITKLPVNKRSVNIVFQNYALFPHLNVFNNVAYSLLIQKRPKDEIEARVLKILNAFHLENHIFKFPNQLSGGQQQRVALARAIINEPDVLLLDEPLAALDFNLREKMLIELIDLQDKLETTFIYVTHDQFEALTVADHMAIMNHKGEIEQIGTPKEIYEFPVSSFVAKFVGTTNLFTGTLHHLNQDPEIQIPHLGRFKVYIPQKKPWMTEGCEASMSMRPEKVFISKKPMTNFSDSLKGVVSQIVYYGRSTQYNVVVNNQFKIQVFEQNEEHFPQEDIDYDDEVYLYWQKENILLLEN
ncbi:MAG: ABC transporter ATP-binding protein [Simkania sp.]|uniref:Spermidine/putrescine import ATP-binding protein PotA n=1 Tax=Simkania negevensis (strain ATCC VR-1471 / DSM 27360 / Z) TaxID=331113 RepID=F8L7H7_SIMNZ|nr:ABC transporter ATP-binding protein [Simkania negevensis]MCB1075923.1 ABC transporter ATP-binding protein [Simkania sp.]MCB1082761.1 ABC transporter ATP-binding protein [Simkania sp.]MCP5491185.1 ABC transporter ATP-binding protein [Chlamydiales bacterium]CCB88710.1 spermidine/putrescine import ATP-binding protein PotA [Simkania negevensis Z]